MKWEASLHDKELLNHGIESESDDISAENQKALDEALQHAILRKKAEHEMKVRNG